MLQALSKRGLCYLYTTKRLHLVGIKPHHLASLKKLWTNPLVMANIGFPQGLHPDDIDLESYISTPKNSTPKGRKSGIHMVVELLDGTFIGEAKIAKPNQEGISEPDLKLLPEFWGQGFASEIVPLLIEENFRCYPLCQTIQFTPNIKNTTAIHLYEKFGCNKVAKKHHSTGESILRGFIGIDYYIMQRTKIVSS